MDTPSTLVAAADGPDPQAGLRAVAALRELLDRLEVLQVTSARELGWSWQDIARILGVSRQAVHKKHARHSARLPGTIELCRSTLRVSTATQSSRAGVRTWQKRSSSRGGWPGTAGG